MSKRKKMIPAVAIAICVCVVVAGAAFKYISGEEGKADNLPTFVAEKGPLIISINESGTIKARDQIVIKSELEGMSTVLWVIPEATRVKEGDILVELDASNLQDAKIDQETVVQNADTAAVAAKEKLAVGENQAKADMDLAQLTLDFAKVDLDKYTGDKGEYETTRTESEASIRLAEEELERAREKLKWSTKLAEEKYISSTELKTDQLAYNKADLNLKLARNKLQLLTDFTYKRQLSQLQSDVKQAEMALDRTKRSASASVIQLQAEQLGAESKLAREKVKLAKIVDQIAKAVIKAPAEGMVVYASSARGSWRGNQEPLEEGQSVHEREELIYLPTGDSVKAEIKVHESSMEKVRSGLPVVITVDALPGKVYTGKVAKIAPLPDAQSMFMNPDLKIYATEIYLEGDVTGLRTGMSCRSEIIVAHYDSAVYVPVQCVVRIGRQPTVYVQDGKKFKERKVEIGLDNNRMVHIKSGLEPGEVALMAPPLAPAEMNKSARTDVLDNMNLSVESPAPVGNDAGIGGDGTGGGNQGGPDGMGRSDGIPAGDMTGRPSPGGIGGEAPIRRPGGGQTGSGGSGGPGGGGMRNPQGGRNRTGTGGAN
jgi:HlyD family secretion protein